MGDPWRMADTLRLAAVPGRSLPREDARFRMVDGTQVEPTIVPSSSYYRRAIARGDVLEVPETVIATKRGKGDAE